MVFGVDNRYKELRIINADIKKFSIVGKSPPCGRSLTTTGRATAVVVLISEMVVLASWLTYNSVPFELRAICEGFGAVLTVFITRPVAVSINDTVGLVTW